MAKVNNPCLKCGYHKVTSPFGWRTLGGVKEHHNGVDIVATDANGKTSKTDYIVAFADGKVTKTLNTCGGTSPSTGNYVQIDHGNGLQTVYYHLKKGSVAVSAGQTVKKGQTIGYMGSTGNSTGAHLHFGVKLNGEWVNPQPYIDGEKEKAPSVSYQVYSAGRWWEEVTDYNDKNSNGYAGVDGAPCCCVRVRPQIGVAKYRVHKLGGGWFASVKSSTKTGTESYAGIPAVHCDLFECTCSVDGYHIEYRVSNTKSKTFGEWTKSGKTAGTKGVAIDKIQMRFVRG